MNINIVAFSIRIIAICRKESIASLVKDIEETLMERQASTKDSTYDNIVDRKIHLCCCQRCNNIRLLIFQGFAYLICHQVTYASDIVTKTHTVFLDINITQFCNKLIYNRVVGSKIYNFH